MATGCRRLLSALLVALCLLSFSGGGALACGLFVRITFAEDYPDWFLIEFLEGEGFALVDLELDLTPSVGTAHIDTPYTDTGGAGGDRAVLVEAFGLTGGSQRMVLKFGNFRAGRSFSLLVDLDGFADQLDPGELHGTEATVRFIRPDGGILKLAGRFDSTGVVELGERACA